MRSDDGWPIHGCAPCCGLVWKAICGRRRCCLHASGLPGWQAIVGRTGEVRAPGLVFVNGELWHARTDDETELVPGEQVEIESVDGLELTVRR